MQISCLSSGLLRTFLFLAFIFLVSSCASKKDVLYFQDIDQLENQVNNVPSIIIEKNDLLSIIVSAEDLESAAPFNLPAISVLRTQGTNQPLNRTQAYLVDSNGNIDMPGLGVIKVAGLTKEDAYNLIKDKLEKFIINPIVNFRILNFKITVLGDVSRPGTYPVEDEQITILEAIGLAGDMSITGNREDVLVIREKDGKQTYGTLDFKSSDLFSSPYYYLKQNDVVVVDPNYAQVQRSVANPNTGIFVSIASLLISVLVILSR